VNVKTAAQRALYNNLGKDEGLALAVDAAVLSSLQDGWKTSSIKTKKVRNAIWAVLEQAFNAAQAAGAPGVQQPGQHLLRGRRDDPDSGIGKAPE
jgi:hypothetical protein